MPEADEELLVIEAVLAPLVEFEADAEPVVPGVVLFLAVLDVQPPDGQEVFA